MSENENPVMYTRFIAGSDYNSLQKYICLKYSSNGEEFTITVCQKDVFHNKQIIQYLFNAINKSFILFIKFAPIFII